MSPNPLPPPLIVGAGPIGLACAIAAQRRGLAPRVIDAGTIAHAIYRYPIGMTFFTTPERLEIGGHPLTCSGAKPTREEALKYYRGVARAEGLSVDTFTRLVDASVEDGIVRCTVSRRDGEEVIETSRLVLATGYFEHPNLLDVPGESLPHVSHWFDEPHVVAGRRVVIVGSRNSAIETALLCWRAGARVTVVARAEALRPSVKFWLRPDFENRVAAGEIDVRFGAQVTAITPRTVEVALADGRQESIAADRVYALTGYHPDFDLLRKLGLTLDEDGRPTLDPVSLESNVRGIHVAGSAGAGRRISEVFIENGRWDGERIFGDPAQRVEALDRYARSPRPTGE